MNLAQPKILPCIDANRHEAHSRLIVSGLTHPEAYSHHCADTIQVVETHSAFVLLTGKYAYKIKKPVNFGFLDFSSLSKRYRFCRKELKLNKQFSPEIYLKVVEIRGDVSSPRVGSHEGEIIEYAVMMNQFPVNSLLLDYVHEDRLNVGHINLLAKTIARVHDVSKLAASDSTCGSPGLIKQWVSEAFTHIYPSPEKPSNEKSLSVITDEGKTVLAFLHSWFVYQGEYLSSVFLNRKATGKIRDCHGDLHLRNLAIINNRIVLFDRIEFNEELRWIDVMSEIAFLLMDLDGNDCTEFANRLINRYLQLTGDYSGLKVLPYYLAYRAVVRAKVAALRCQQLLQNPEERRKLSAEVLHYIHYAHSRTVATEGKLIITHGFSGSGKSFYSEQLCEKIGAIHIRSDVERKRLAGLAPDQKSHSSLNDGIYAVAYTDSVYARLMMLAREVLSAGYSVLLDATFLSYKQRNRAKALAESLGFPFLILDFEAASDTLLRRIIDRQQLAQDPSEAGPEVLMVQRQTAEAITVEEKRFVVKVDTNEKSAAEDIVMEILSKILKRPGSGKE